MLKLACQGQAWHGPSLLQNLDGVTAAMAAQHPIADSHSIFELVRHVSTWIDKVARVSSGEQYVSMEGDDDWPPVTDTSDAAWQSALAELQAARELLRHAMRKFPEDDLEKIVPGKEFSYYVMLHGTVHHILYHAGQIGLLRKAIP